MRKSSKFSIKTFSKWLYPGMKIKRWILLSCLGIIIIGLSSALFLTNVINKQVGIINIFIGVVFAIIGMIKMFKSMLAAFVPEGDQEFIDILYKKRFLERGPKVVAVGGGTGLSTLLKGLKEYTSNITAIVTVADSGGSSGKLREQFDVLPPGDIRNCLVALADAEPLMGDLFQFRFDKDTEFGGHNFGNLFITAMTKLTGDFEQAVKESSKVLAIRGQVIPSTLDRISLVAKYTDGSTMEGEANIPLVNSAIQRVYLKPENSSPTKEAVKAIREADVIVLGPGSLYTSIIPNLLIKDLANEICKRRNIPKIYVCNIMTQLGETDTYSVFDHVRAIVYHARPEIINVCIVNNAMAPREFLKKYKLEKSYPVVVDSHRIRSFGYRVVEGNLIGLTDFVRHDPSKLSKLIFDIISESKNIKR
jgi:uncharacterized cofD-like protein